MYAQNQCKWRNDDMEYIRIPGLDKPLSRLIFGTSRREEKVSDMIPLLDEYIRAGGNVIDTAMYYNGGESESVLGQWMEERGNREQLVIITKGCHPTKEEPNRVSPEMISKDLAGSLQRLRVEYVDLYLLHRDDPSQPVGPLVETLNEHIAAGRIKQIGVSNWTWQRIEEANEYAAKHGLKGFVASSVHLSLAKPLKPLWPGCLSADKETCLWHERNAFPLLSWSSQARGFFSGKYKPDDLSDAYMVEVFYSEENWERYRRAQILAEQKGTDTAQIALAYVLNQPFPVCSVVGSFTIHELISNVEAVGIKLSPEEIRWLALQAESI
jgi:aryl-alcohol dehydrogenase-like predicted oxidoreductase